MKIALLVILLAVSACAPKAVIVEPIAPQVTRARASVEASASSSARLEKKVAGINANTSALAVEVSKAVAESDRLRKIGTATPQELEEQWKALTGIQSRNLFLEAETAEAVQNAEEQRFLREAANQRLAELEQSATVHDKSVETLKTEVVKQAGNAAIGQFVKGAFWTFAIFAAIGLVLWVAIKLKPTLL